mgnify:FL=1
MTKEDRVSVISTFLQIGSLYECVVDKIPDQTMIVFDEGFIQKSFMFVSTKKDFEMDRTPVHAYLDQIPLPHAVIRVRADLGSCYERLMTRQQGLTERLRRLNNVQRTKDFLLASEKHIDDVVCWLETNTQVEVLEVRNDHDMDICLNDLHKRLKEIFLGPR